LPNERVPCPWERGHATGLVSSKPQGTSRMHVRVVHYCSEWALLFEQEAALIRGVSGDELVAIHHIGSTSVPGLQAKPIIDMLPVARQIEQVELFNEGMQALGYEALGEFGIPGRRYFRKGGDDRTHQAHVFQVGDPGVERHLAFRDYLRAHPEVAAEYGVLKAGLAQQFPEDINRYVDGKDAFVKAAEQEALRWYRARGAQQPS
jgi:GrpB-like predicted nucleotidyltransferase (UPF0157 family)